MKERILYLIFLFVACFIAFGSSPSSSVYFTKSMSLLFIERKFSNGDGKISFKGISFTHEIWKYLEDILIEGIHLSTFNKSNEENMPSNLKRIMVLDENMLLGTPRIRQLRVKNNSCVIHPELSMYFKKCYAEYSYGAEDTSPFGDKYGTAWTYSSAYKIDAYSYWGQLATYKGGGYYIDLPNTKEESLRVLNYLKSKNWLDRSTRVLFIDFTLYNANLNLFSIVKIVFERSPIGIIIPSWSAETVNLLQFVDLYDEFLLVFEIIFTIILIYYTGEMILNVFTRRFSYFKQFWNIIDLAIIMISYVIIGFDLYNYMYLYNKLTHLIQIHDHFWGFEGLDIARVEMNNATAIFIFLLWLKLFKYLRFNLTLLQLNTTLTRCAKDVLSFSFIFFIIFAAFAQMGTLLFGSKVNSYSTFGLSTITLFRTILGDFNYMEIKAANSVLGPIFFFFYTFFIFIVLLNMFLAILTETYTQVKTETAINANGEFKLPLKSLYVDVSAKIKKVLIPKNKNNKEKFKSKSQFKDSSYVNKIQKKCGQTLAVCNESDSDEVFHDDYGIKKSCRCKKNIFPTEDELLIVVNNVTKIREQLYQLSEDVDLILDKMELTCEVWTKTTRN